MGNRGRYGKYGEQKRNQRLRDGRVWAARLSGMPPSAPPLHRPGGKRVGPYSGFSTRPAAPSDAEFVRTLSRVFRIYGPYEAILTKWFQAGMTLTRIGLRDGRPEGFAMLGPVSAGWCFPKACELLAIAVASSARRMGLADLMLREMELLAARLGAEKLILHTSADNEAARRLFVKRGFSFAEDREKFYPEGQDAVCMIKKLDAESSGA